MATASFRWILQLHKDVPKAARFYAQGLDFSVNVVTLRWAELQSGPLKLALMQSPSEHVVSAELDGSIKYEVHGKVASVRCLDGHVLGLYEPS
ncbi:hypothetical protein DY000_02012454 [Brassica cretica]|uniref:Glyoxalase/fosfomycin resistance/dioxygenase domain-containing protein n=1 Tax=Brassica cretica TaxID=69181 RepID=A0ABQ7D1V6_BRACR|nr:hypothetical protein DY000_02012454 [Brassica cretica]